MQKTADFNNIMLFQDAIMNSKEDIVTIKNLHLKYLAVNKTFLKIFGFDNDSMVLNKGIEEVLTSQNCRVIEKNTKEIINTKQSKTFTLNFENKSKLKYLKTIAYPIIQNGEVSAFLSISRDETQEADIKLKLVDKVCVINSLLDNLPMIVYMKDKNNNYITGSKYAKKFFQEGIDVYAGNIQLDMKEAIDVMNFEDNYVINNKSVIIREKATIAIDGREHWYKIYKAPILDSNNEVNGLVIISQNIDAEKQLEIQKELFLATLTHDLKTPLQAQISSMKSILNGTFGSLNDSQKEIMDMLIESSNFMKEMLYSILTVYKYENGMVRLYKEYFDMGILVNKCIKESYQLAREKKIKVEYREYADNKMVYADKNQIRRVIVNVLNNAMNYAYKNTTIYINICENNEFIVTKIRNISEKIPHDISEHIFDKYISGTGIKRGIGLGLYFCKKVIESHGGRITLNAFNTNNEFVIELPEKEIETSESTLKFV